jgi:hypothetical protein
LKQCTFQELAAMADFALDHRLLHFLLCNIVGGIEALNL